MTSYRSAARIALRGLALGDAFGEAYARRRSDGSMPPGPWPWTDDTAMALALLRTLSEYGEVVPDDLADRFAAGYAEDPTRGYGRSMRATLRAIGTGESWAAVAARPFGGRGSWGNGAAMRVAPLGVWFAAEPDRVVNEAARSAVVTHAHPEAIAGAIAVAVAAALAVRGGTVDGFLDAVATRTPDSEVATRLRRIANHPPGTAPERIAAEVGCGERLSAPDTVPYAIWCAARHLDDLAEALPATASAGGDTDTTCAMVGGIVAARTGLHGVPVGWLDAGEPLPEWVG